MLKTHKLLRKCALTIRVLENIRTMQLLMTHSKRASTRTTINTTKLTAMAKKRVTTTITNTDWLKSRLLHNRIEVIPVETREDAASEGVVLSVGGVHSSAGNAAGEDTSPETVRPLTRV